MSWKQDLTSLPQIKHPCKPSSLSLNQPQPEQYIQNLLKLFLFWYPSPFNFLSDLWNGRGWMNSSIAHLQIPSYPCGMTRCCLSSQQKEAIKKRLGSLCYSSVSPPVSTATVLGPSSGPPVGYLQVQSNAMQTQTGAFKAILRLFFLEVFVPSGFWKTRKVQPRCTQSNSNRV